MSVASMQSEATAFVCVKSWWAHQQTKSRDSKRDFVFIKPLFINAFRNFIKKENYNNYNKNATKRKHQY